MGTTVFDRRAAALLVALLVAVAASACGDAGSSSVTPVASTPANPGSSASTPPPGAVSSSASESAVTTSAHDGTAADLAATSLDRAATTATSAAGAVPAAPRWLVEPMTCTSLAGGLPGSIPDPGMTSGSIVPDDVTSADVCALSGPASGAPPIARLDVPAAELSTVLERIGALPTYQGVPCPATSEWPLALDGLILRNARGETFPILLDGNPLGGDPGCGLVRSPAGIRVLGPDLTINLAIEQIAAATRNAPDQSTPAAASLGAKAGWTAVALIGGIVVAGPGSRVQPEGVARYCVRLPASLPPACPDAPFGVELRGLQMADVPWTGRQDGWRWADRVVIEGRLRGSVMHVSHVEPVSAPAP